MSARPELVAPPEIFYNAEEARKYTSNSHMIETQARAALLSRVHTVPLLTPCCFPYTGAADRAGAGAAGAPRRRAKGGDEPFSALPHAAA